MNSKIKITSILILTLIIGMVLGAAIHGSYMKNRFKRSVSRMRTPDGFVKRYEKIIEPNDSQKEVVEKILLKTYDKLQQLFRPPTTQFENIMDSLRWELKPILTVEQNEKLTHYFEEARKRSREHHRGRKPPESEEVPEPPNEKPL
jgi:hypothetical protein